MIYEYFCTNETCKSSQEEDHSVNGFKEFRPKCEKCGSECEYKFVPTIVQVALLDGPCGSWPSKGERFKKYRAQASEAAGRRQREHREAPKGLIPNYKGVEADSWEHAKEMAVKDVGESGVSSFDSKIKEETLTKT